ncbi:immunity 49 family protein [Actinokineospora globicatena]|uniref:Immunity protein 49 n=1 Tax=Actinokineospora globicatena TaxID=103729 RepID=A0A9W6QMM0_9PSEU|nr:immunity 49 family protein [Actinokineospora globicatena]GLW91123.1 hypothetical protein Aglo03_19390 [Actinokineospora globicatena]
MTIAIDRHPIDQEIAADQGGVRPEALRRMLGHARTTPKALPSLLDWATSSFAYATAADPRAEREQTWDHLVLAAQSAAAVFALVVPDLGEPTELLIRGERITLPATGPTTDTGPHQWLRAHDLAISVRSKGLLDILLDVPTELLRLPTSPEYLLAYVDTLKSYWRADPATLDALQATVDLTVPTDFAAPQASPAVRLYLPQMKSLYHLATHQAADLQAAIAEGLEKHQAYWTGKDFAADPSGFIAYPLLAQATTAHSVGITLDIDSPYLPAAIVREQHTYTP